MDDRYIRTKEKYIPDTPPAFREKIEVLVLSADNSA